VSVELHKVKQVELIRIWIKWINAILWGYRPKNTMDQARIKRGLSLGLVDQNAGASNSAAIRASSSGFKGAPRLPVFLVQTNGRLVTPIIGRRSRE
jgi:hypothetical protein